MRLSRAWIYLSGILATYYCMSLWGLGIHNPVKYYLYTAVLLFSFLLTSELRHRVSLPVRLSLTDTRLLVLIITLIIAGTSAVLFSEYELWMMYKVQHQK